MKQSSKEEENNKIQMLLEVINSFQGLLKRINENRGKKKKTILLIGNTGSGKSTIFNWLSGAQFEFQNKELQFIKEEGKNFSVQGNSLQSITFEPNFNPIDDDHILIDFPGFKDTNGTQKQLSIQLMFNEVVTSTDVKLAFVVLQSSKDFTDRSQCIQELLQNTLTLKNGKFDSIGLILNQFLDKELTTDEKAIPYFQKQLQDMEKGQEQNTLILCKALYNNIIIIRKVNSQKSKFTDVQRKSIIEQLKTIKPIQFQPDKVDQDEIVSDYIKTKFKHLFVEYESGLIKKKDEAQKRREIPQFQNTLKEKIKEIDSIKFDDLQHVIEWMNKNVLIDILQEKETIEFLQIFRFFFKYQASIQGYQTFKEKISEIKQRVESLIQEIQAEISRIQDEQERFRKRLEEQKRRNDLYLEKVQRDEENKMRRIRDEMIKKKKEEEEEEQKKIQKQQFQKELQEKQDQNLKKQKQLEDDKKKYEQMLKQHEEEKQKRLQKKNKLIDQLNNCKNKIHNLIRNREDYKKEQQGLYMAVFGGDRSDQYYKKISDFNSQIVNQEKVKAKVEEELLLC